ncbi:MAG: ABC transporter ATP-binding protein [Lachnospiraceae bacterium]|nr:ABC transporter ATP-binding protein [Lachnospiraceae bacterium]
MTEGAFFMGRGLSVGYQGRAIVEGMDFYAERGDLLVLMGPNGAGKSTVLKAVAGHLPLLGGELLLDGADMGALPMAERARKVSALFPGRLRTEHLNCREMVEMGRYPYTGYFGILGEADHEAVAEAMALTDVEELAGRDFMQLSDGQRQRVLLARALSQAPELLVLDEPTAFLDIRYQLEFLALLRKLCRERRMTAVLSVHEAELAWRAADRLLCIKDGKAAAFGTPEEVVRDGLLQRLFDIQPQRLEMAGQPALMEYAQALGKRK